MGTPWIRSDTYRALAVHTDRAPDAMAVSALVARALAGDREVALVALVAMVPEASHADARASLRAVWGS